jgi:site-specific recombinase XerD
MLDISGFTVNDLEKLTEADIYAYLMFLGDNLRNSAVTRSRKLTCLKSFMTYLHENKKILSRHIAREIESPKTDKKLPRFLELDEAKQLLNAADGEFQARDFLIITLLLNTGIRVGELFRLKIDDIKKDRMTIMGKGSRERFIFLNDAIRKVLAEYYPLRSELLEGKPKADALILSYNGKPMSISGIQYRVKIMVENAGLDNRYSCHLMRHRYVKQKLKTF